MKLPSREKLVAKLAEEEVAAGKEPKRRSRRDRKVVSYNEQLSEKEFMRQQEMKAAAAASQSTVGTGYPPGLGYEVAACDPDHEGPWEGEWEPCELLSRNPGGYWKLKILSDGMVCKRVDEKFVRPGKIPKEFKNNDGKKEGGAVEAQPEESLILGTTCPEPPVLQERRADAIPAPTSSNTRKKKVAAKTCKKKIPAAPTSKSSVGNESTEKVPNLQKKAPAATMKKQQRQHPQQPQPTAKASDSFSLSPTKALYEVAACDASHEGEWLGEWEKCHLISRTKRAGCTVKILSDGVVCKNVPPRFVRLAAVPKKTEDENKQFFASLFQSETEVAAPQEVVENQSHKKSVSPTKGKKAATPAKKKENVMPAKKNVTPSTNKANENAPARMNAKVMPSPERTAAYAKMMKKISTSSVDKTDRLGAAELDNWVQCENTQCQKWRKIPFGSSIDVSALPSPWTCSMNTWRPAAANCDAPEETDDPTVSDSGRKSKSSAAFDYLFENVSSNSEEDSESSSDESSCSEEESSEEDFSDSGENTSRARKKQKCSRAFGGASKWVQENYKALFDSICVLGFPEVDTKVFCDEDTFIADIMKVGRPKKNNFCVAVLSNNQLFDSIFDHAKASKRLGDKSKSEVVTLLSEFKSTLSTSTAEVGKKVAPIELGNFKVSPKRQAILKRKIKVLQRFRSKVLRKNTDHVYKAVERFVVGANKYKTAQPKLKVPNEWYSANCKSVRELCKMDLCLLSSVAMHGFDLQKWDQFAFLTRQNTAIIESIVGGAEMTDTDRKLETFLFARFEALCDFVCRFNPMGTLSFMPSAIGGGGHVGAAKQPVAQASLSSFLAGGKIDKKIERGTEVVHAPVKSKRKPLKKPDSIMQEFPELQIAINKALSEGKEVSSADAQAVSAAILQRTQLPYDLVGGTTLLEMGKLGDPPMNSSRYIFPIGYKSQRMHTSFRNPNTRVMYTQEIREPLRSNNFETPSFVLTAADAPDEPIVSDSTPGRAWSMVLGRTESKKKEMGLPPSGLAISGPNFFGLTNPRTVLFLEGLKGAEKCKNYRFSLQRKFIHEKSVRENKAPKKTSPVASPSFVEANTPLTPNPVATTGTAKESTEKKRASAANTLLGPNKKAKVGNVGTPSTGTKPKVRSGTTAAPLKGMGIMSFFLKSKGTHSANHPIA